MIGLLHALLRGRRAAQPAEPAAGAPLPAARRLRGSVSVLHVDAGSCNGCQVAIASAFGPGCDAERHGARLVTSARDADALLVTGPVARHMRVPLERTYAAAPRPVLVVAVGDCASDCGGSGGGDGVCGAVSEVLPVDLAVPGCPPPPETIVAALRRLTGR